VTRRLVAAAAVAASLAFVPAAGAAGCPSGFKSQPTGFYSPLTGKPIMACLPYPGP
jgi:hypothetical protein